MQSVSLSRYAQAIELLKNGKYHQQKGEWKLAQECYSLGIAYLKTLVEKGHSQAGFLLGKLYLAGTIVEKNIILAISYLEFAFLHSTNPRTKQRIAETLANTYTKISKDFVDQQPLSFGRIAKEYSTKAHLIEYKTAQGKKTDDYATLDNDEDIAHREIFKGEKKVGFSDINKFNIDLEDDFKEAIRFLLNIAPDDINSPYSEAAETLQNYLDAEIKINKSFTKDKQFSETLELSKDSDLQEIHQEENSLENKSPQTSESDTNSNLQEILQSENFLDDKQATQTSKSDADLNLQEILQGKNTLDNKQPTETSESDADPNSQQISPNERQSGKKSKKENKTIMFNRERFKSDLDKAIKKADLNLCEADKSKTTAFITEFLACRQKINPQKLVNIKHAVVSKLREVTSDYSYFSKARVMDFRKFIDILSVINKELDIDITEGEANLLKESLFQAVEKSSINIMPEDKDTVIEMTMQCLINRGITKKPISKIYENIIALISVSCYSPWNFQYFRHGKQAINFKGMFQLISVINDTLKPSQTKTFDH